MGFASGSVSFRRFVVVGKSPAAITQAVLDTLSEHALRPSELGVPEEVEYGWCGGRHVLDGSFSFEHNIYADALYCAMRVDTNKVPGELKKAYTMMQEEAAAQSNPSGFISKNQKRDAKEQVRRQIEDELRSGKFRRSKLLPVLWDLPGATVYSPASGGSFEKLAELFERSFGLDLQPVSAGSLALRLLEKRRKRRDYEDSRPTRFVPGPGEGDFPEYPWVAKGPQPKDFMGNEFLLWLWHEADHRAGTIVTEEAGQVTVFFDRLLELDCAYGQSGHDALRGDGPSRMPEARDALRSGKVPRKAGLVIDAGGQQYNLTLGAEALEVSGGKLPDVPDADSERVLFEERVGLLRDLSKTMDALFDTFLKVRAGSAWEGHTNGIRRWIQSNKPAAAA